MSTTNQRYEVVQSGIQKILCIIYHSIYLLYAVLCHGSIIMSTKTLGDSKGINPLKFFAKLESFIDLTFCFIAIYTVFYKFSKLHALLDIIQDNHSILQISNWKPKYLIGLALFIFFWIFSPLINICEMEKLHLSVADVSIGLTPLLGVNQISGESSQEGKMLSSLDNSIQIILHLLLGYGRGISESLSFIMFAFGMYLRNLLESLRISVAAGRITPSEILQDYLHIKQLNEVMNKMCGLLLLHYVIGTVPCFAKLLLNLSQFNGYLVLQTIHTTVCYLATMISSASANDKLDVLKEEMLLQRSKRNGFYSDEKLSTLDEHTNFITLLTEFSSKNSIGLKGWRFFTATYQFLGVMMAQCVVYALILLQFKTDS